MKNSTSNCNLCSFSNKPCNKAKKCLSKTNKLINWILYLTDKHGNIDPHTMVVLINNKCISLFDFIPESKERENIIILKHFFWNLVNLTHSCYNHRDSYVSKLKKESIIDFNTKLVELNLIYERMTLLWEKWLKLLFDKLIHRYLIWEFSLKIWELNKLMDEK